MFSACWRSPVRWIISRRKRCDLISRHGAEVLVERLPGFELLAVDEKRTRTGERVAVLVEVSKQLETAVFQSRGAVGILANEAGNVIVDQLRGRGVVADDDEAGRNFNLRFFP